MTSLLRACVGTIALVLFLSITFKNKTIFGHVYSVISPITRMAQDKVENGFGAAFTSVSNYTKRLFANSVPRLKDSVKSKMSAPQKMSGDPAEEIKPEEKKELEQLIKRK